MNWSVWLSSNTPGTRPVLNGCQLPQSQPVICLGVLPCQAENSLKAEPPSLCSCGDRGPGHFFPAPKLAYEIVRRESRRQQDQSETTDYGNTSLTPTNQLNCEESWVNWSVAPELRTVKYSTMPQGWASGFHIWTYPVTVPGHGTVGPTVWKRATYGPGYFRLKAQTQHQIDEGPWWRMVMAQRHI